MARLFDPYTLRGLTLRNRIVMPPMCLWASDPDGEAGDWHFVHYGTRAVGGAGLIIIEATAVERRGRIDDQVAGDLGIWDDRHMAPLARIARFGVDQGAAMAIQLAHAGRKANSGSKGHRGEPGVAPSAVPFDAGWQTPHALAPDELAAIVGSFRAAARRAVHAGFQAIELHAAHGYLLSSFLSPLANQRSDAYGGTIERRARFACEVVAAVRGDLPDPTPLIVRVSATDWVEGGNTVDDMVTAASLLKEAGADLIHVSAGGNSPRTPPTYPGYMIELAQAIKQGANVPTIAVGLIRTPELAEEVVRNGRADLVALGRELLRAPYWPLQAAQQLEVDLAWPQPYIRAKP
ncbi:MAG: oxidoreductase [Planctomycetes bacterium]|jgi:2,4-dienoyl-CoA reductase-like NADH-dependent reductase (Old Yellow Enzyme family)|nr:oxidoreductase [Planctomycetota bacterium]